MLKLVDGQIKRVDEPALTALNMRLRDDYSQDCVKGMLRWNKIISTAGYDFKLTLPNVAFHRQIGEFKDIHATPDGLLIDDATWNKRKNDWLPSTDDGDFIASLMTPVTEAGEFALLDFAAQGRDRQQARRLRVCENRDVRFSSSPSGSRRAQQNRGSRLTQPSKAHRSLTPQERGRGSCDAVFGYSHPSPVMPGLA